MRSLSMFAALVLCTAFGSSAMAAPTAPTMAEVRVRIAQRKASSPTAFMRLSALRDRVPELDRTKHGRIVVLGPSFRALGADALLPMLEMLSAQTPAPGFSESARVALYVGLLDAVGALRDPGAAPVLDALLTGNEQNRAIVRATAEAFGKLGDDATAGRLVSLAKQPGTKRLGVVEGLGTCRRPVVAHALASLATDISQAEVSLAAIRSLGLLGAAWAWETPRLVTTGEGETVRSIAADSLVRAFVLAPDEPSRRAAETAILMVDHPATPSLVAAERARATPSAVALLDRLSVRLAHNPVRGRQSESPGATPAP